MNFPPISKVWPVLALNLFTTYNQANYNFPIVRVEDLETRVSRFDPDYRSLVASLPGGYIKQRMLGFLDSQKIRSDLIVYEASDVQFEAKGSNYFTSADAAIFIPAGFCEADKEACSFLMKHEISHIKNNDLFTRHAAQVIYSFTNLFMFSHIYNSPAQFMAYELISPFLVNIIVSQWQEINADNFAIENSSDEELLGGRRFFKAIKEVHLNAREIIPLGTIIISSTGENLKDVSHPSLESRAQKIESILAERNVSFATDEENNKIAALVPFIR